MLSTSNGATVATILTVLAFNCAGAQEAGPMARPIVGAIRWDAWHGDASNVGQVVEGTLGPKRYHHRLPFFAKVLSDSEVEIRGDTQAVMDREIEAAHKAGLDYWAFVTYPEEYAMSAGLKLYLSSACKQDIHFCLDKAFNIGIGLVVVFSKVVDIDDLIFRNTHRRIFYISQKFFVCVGASVYR